MKYGLIFIFAPLLVSISTLTCAGSTPEGTWASFNDDHTNVQAWVRIDNKDGFLEGYVVKILDPNASSDEICKRCKGSKKNLPILGLKIIEGISSTPIKKNIWTGGLILDPESGDEYKLYISINENGRELFVRGYWGIFWREQRWSRISE